MHEQLQIGSVLAFIERHGYALLFFWVLAEQSAIPLPSAPLLVAAGALIHGGRLHMAAALLCCTTGALVADTIWFQLGRHRGHQILRLICRVSLEPDSCVRQTENAFLKHGLKSLLVSKFVPGLNALAAPLAGFSGASYIRFVLYDSVGALIWSGVFISLGYVFNGQLETVVDYGSRMGSGLFFLVAAMFACWIGWKYVQRRRVFRQLDVARITPAELQERLAANEELFIVDLRSGLGAEPAIIPGAVRISAEDLAVRGQEIPRDREIILFCT